MKKKDVVEIINPESMWNGKIGEVIGTKTGAILLLKVLIEGRVLVFSETEIMKAKTKKGM